jgi:NADPH:quinone reductase-like Zn-dependent oxidoreductase
MVTQLATEVGAYIIGTGRAADRRVALDHGAQEFVDLDNDALTDVGGVDLVFDVIGGDVGTNIGNVASLDDAVTAFNPTERVRGKTIIRVRTEDRRDVLGIGRRPHPLLGRQQPRRHPRALPRPHAPRPGHGRGRARPAAGPAAQRTS